MLAKVNSCAVVGLDGELVEVEVDISGGGSRPSTSSACRTPPSRRPRSACAPPSATPASPSPTSASPSTWRRPTCGRKAPPTTCPSPSGIVLASEQVAADVSRRRLPGRAIAGREACATPTASCRWWPWPASAASRSVFVPEADARRGRPGRRASRSCRWPRWRSWPSTCRGWSASSPWIEPAWPAAAAEPVWQGVDFCHVKGQEHVKRALEVAAAGGHNVLMTGPPGAGKTLLARALPSILPSPDAERGAGGDQDLQRQRPPALRQAADHAAALPLAAPHHLARRAGRRRPLAAAGRDQPEPPGRALPGRAAGVRPRGAGGAAPAAGGPGGDHQPRPGQRHLPGQLHAGGGDEPLPLRLLRRPARRSAPARTPR